MPKFLLVVSWFLASVSPLSAQQKRVLAVLDLSGDGGSRAELTAITRLLTSSIFETGLADVIDPSKRSQILAEIEFSNSDCSDQSCAIEIGRLLAADIMVVGSLSAVGSQLAVDLKALDVSTSRIVGTYFRLYKGVDSVVADVNRIGAEFMQALTGEMAARKEVLAYEQLAPLIIVSSHEGARISINGAPVGKVRDGRFTKAVNRDAVVDVVVSCDGFYDKRFSVEMIGQQSVEVRLDPIVLHRFGLEALVGGGTMFSFAAHVYAIPNWFYVRAGVGATMSVLVPALVNVSATLRSGSYIAGNDRARIRPHLGVSIVAPMVQIVGSRGIQLQAVNPTLEGMLGMIVGLDLRLTEHLRAALEFNVTVAGVADVIEGIRVFASAASDPVPFVQIAAGLRFYD